MSLSVDAIKEQIKNLQYQRDLAAERYQQCVGAIAILSEQLNMCAEAELKKNSDDSNQGESPNERIEC